MGPPHRAAKAGRPGLVRALGASACASILPPNPPCLPACPFSHRDHELEFAFRGATPPPRLRPRDRLAHLPATTSVGGPSMGRSPPTRLLPAPPRPQVFNEWPLPPPLLHWWPAQVKKKKVSIAGAGQAAHEARGPLSHGRPHGGFCANKGECWQEEGGVGGVSHAPGNAQDPPPCRGKQASQGPGRHMSKVQGTRREQGGAQGPL